MTLRSIPHDFLPDALARVDALLDQVESEHNATTLIAVESTSRAWGFPSPDSDYDCRFVYVRSLECYLSPWPPPDVIETLLIDDMDLNGWDLGKALKLMLKGNAVIIEWLMSPIIYRGDSRFRAECLALTEAHTDRSLIARHYLHLGMRQRNTYFGDGKDVALKKLFYALRPAAALRWMRMHPNAQLPPMDFQTLMAECDMPSDVAETVAELLARKAVTNELGAGPLPNPIRKFVDSEFDLAQSECAPAPKKLSPEAREAANDFFSRWVTCMN